MFERLTRLAEDADISWSRLSSSWLARTTRRMNGLCSWPSAPRSALASSWSASCSWGVTRMNGLRNMAKQARASEAQFLEHLILRAEAIYNFQPPVLPPPRPWWKLWSKEEREPELPAIVADLRNAA